MRSSFAVASLLVGLFCFIQLLGIEKAILAIILGFLAFNEIKSQDMSGRSLAIVGIVLGVIYILLVLLALPYLSQLFSNLI